MASEGQRRQVAAREFAGEKRFTAFFDAKSREVMAADASRGLVRVGFSGLVRVETQTNQSEQYEPDVKIVATSSELFVPQPRRNQRSGSGE